MLPPEQKEKKRDLMYVSFSQVLFLNMRLGYVNEHKSKSLGFLNLLLKES